MSESIWQKNSLVTHIFFDLCLFQHFSPVANFAQQSIAVTQPFFLDCIASKTNFTYTYTLHFFIPAEAEKGCYDSWKWQSFSCDKNDWNHLVLESIWIANHVEYIFISAIMQNWHRIWQINWNYFPGSRAVIQFSFQCRLRNYFKLS